MTTEREIASILHHYELSQEAYQGVLKALTDISEQNIQTRKLTHDAVLHTNGRLLDVEAALKSADLSRLRRDVESIARDMDELTNTVDTVCRNQEHLHEHMQSVRDDIRDMRRLFVFGFALVLILVLLFAGFVAYTSGRL